MEIFLQEQREISSQIKTEIAIYRVSSHQLCSVSPVFAAMLGPQSSFAEATALRATRAHSTKEGSLYRITLEDDNVRAMAIMLNVIHARSSSVPRELNLGCLLQMAIISDKYDCADAMKPWDELWMDPWLSGSDKDRFDERLFISVVFRVHDVFKKLTRKYSRQAIVINGELVLPENHLHPNRRLNVYTPESVLAAIQVQRAEAMKAMLTQCRKVYKKIRQDKRHNLRFFQPLSYKAPPQYEPSYLFKLPFHASRDS